MRVMEGDHVHAEWAYASLFARTWDATALGCFLTHTPARTGRLWKGTHGRRK